MWGFSEGAEVPAFGYPSLVTWAPPQSGSDCVGKSGNSFEVAGLGPAQPASREFATSGKTPGVWQWLDLWFGQRVLMKRRLRPTALPSSQRVDSAQQYLTVPSRHQVAASAPLPPPPGSSAPAHQTFPLDDGASTAATSYPSLHELTDRVIASDFDPTVVGQVLLELSDRSDGLEASIAYVSIITKARMSRRDRDRRRNDG
jgi:hypothetical protein